MNRTSIYSTLRGLRQCLGEFRDLDYMIRVYRENFQPDFSHPVDHSILMHEWTHYLQFLGTPVGRFISYIRRTLLQMEVDLIRQCPQPLYVPVLRWLEQQPKIVNETPGLGGILGGVLLLQKQWDRWVGLHGASWDTKLSSTTSKMPKISAEYLRNHEPIKLDLEKGAFLFSFPDGRQETFEVRELQVLEFMARAVEIDYACSNGFWEDLHGYIDIWDFGSFDYHAPILYLIQTGTLGREIDSKTWAWDNNGLFFPLLIVACQIALMDSIYVLKDDYDPGSTRWENALFPGTNLPAQRRTVSAPAPSGFTGFPGKTFLRLLRKLGTLYQSPDDWDSLMQLAADGRNTENWIAVADSFCAMAEAPKYSEMRSLALEAVRDEWARLSVQKYPLSIERFGPVLKAEYEAAILAHELLLKRPDVTGYPLRLFRELPFPIIAMYMPGKLGFGLAPFLPGGSITRILSPKPALFFWAWNHLVEKLLYDSDLGCFWEDNPSDTFWHCPELHRCSERLKQLKLMITARMKPNGLSSLLKHCTNRMWRQAVTQALNNLGISDVQPLEAC